MGLVAANAALYPHVLVRMYGVEMGAQQLLMVYLLLDVVQHQGGPAGGGGMRQVDVSAHAGGAAVGWVLATRWRRWWM